MELAILFWCYKEAGLCANRLQLLRHYNPDAFIYVLFGGAPNESQQFETELLPHSDDFYAFPEDKPAQWKWVNGDMLISRWFTERGHLLKWDSIAVIQWDMLVFGPMEKLFRHLKENEVLLAGARPVEEVKAWYPWVRPECRYYRQYVDFLKDNNLQEHDAWFFPFVVAVLARAFLERFSTRNNPETGFLEYTIPTLAKSWGFDFCTDHSYTPWWWHGSRHSYHTMLNSNKTECPDLYVFLHLLEPWGLRIFHPYSRDLRADRLSHALPAWLNFWRCTESDHFGESMRAMERRGIAGYGVAVPNPVTQPATEHPTICLNMIVRNEAYVASEVLDSVVPHISSWVIVDTGSEDGTQDVIRNYMARLGIRGELHERPWRNFGHNRSEALALAQGHGDYIWVIDADDIIVGTPDFTRLGADIYWLPYEGADGHTRWRPQLFRDGVPVRYVGVTDECAAWDDPWVVARLEGEYHIEGRHFAAGAPDPLGQARDLLLAEVEYNPGDALSVSYLANSYFDLGDFVNARKWYARWVEMGSWDVYIAIYRIAESLEKLGAPWPQVEDAYLRAWKFRPDRAEALHAIARRYREAQEYRLGYQFAERAAQIPFPDHDLIDIGADVYAWRATDEKAVCAAGTGKHAESFALCRGLLARPDIPDDDRQRIAGNRDVCVPTMLDAAAAYPEALVQSLQRPAARLRDAEVVVSLVAGPARDTAEQMLNSFLNCCTDVSRIGRFVAVDVGLSAQDRAMLQQRYGFLEFPCSGAELAHIRAAIHERFWLHLDQGWQFFAPERFITRLTAVLEAEPEVFQVGINFADAVKLTGTCATEQVVRRAPDAGRYVLADVVASGPAMFDTARLDRAGVELGRGAPTAGLRIASLDEVLCIAATA